MEAISDVLVAIPTWLVLPVIIGIVIYWHLRDKYSYWKRVGIPYVMLLPFTRYARKISRMPLHEMELDFYQTHGRIYGYYEGTKPILTVAEPDILRDIMVKNFQIFTGRRRLNAGNPVDSMLANLRGKDWKRVRTVVSPTFSTGKIKKMTSIFIDSAKTLTNNFKTAAREEKPVDVERLFGAFTMDVIASAAFATKIDSHNDPENPFVGAAKNVFRTNVTWRLILYVLLPSLIRFFKISIFHPGAMNFFQNATLKIVEERKQSGQRRNDFLQLMIDAVEKGVGKENADSNENDKTQEMGHDEKDNDQAVKSDLNTKALSNDELVAQCISFFLAGYNTIAATLAFTAYELALQPDVQDKLIAEIDGTIEKEGELNYEAISEMKYLDNVISETLRKYPPAIRTERLAEEDYHIKEYNITVPKGMLVGIPVYAIHHDPEYYPDPEKYDPERFSEEEKSSRHPYTYLPFGAGPRNCVAMRFALMEIKVCLAYVLSQCRFITCAETDVPLQFVRNLLSMQPKKLALKLEVRNLMRNYEI